MNGLTGNIMNRFFKSMNIVLVAVLSIFVFAACEDSGDDGSHGTWPNFGNSGPSSSSSSSISSSSGLPGTWKLVAGDGSSWYIHFGSDGTWKITDDVAGSQRRVYGSYSASGSSYSGNMTNPGVGDGTISGQIQGNTISLDFCEHWHSPYKHVAYTGTKL